MEFSGIQDIFFRQTFGIVNASAADHNDDFPGQLIGARLALSEHSFADCYRRVWPVLRLQRRGTTGWL
jgi:hypothetical protein